MFDQPPSPVAASELLNAWNRWAERDPDVVLGDSEDGVPVEHEVAWPAPGSHHVMPYVVEATVVAGPATTTYALRLFVRRGRRFAYERDHLWAMTSKDSPLHIRLGDLLVTNRKARSRGRGSALLSGFEAMCRRRGIRWIEGGISRVDDLGRLDNFYRHRGYSVLKGVAGEPFVWTLLKDVST